MSALIHHRLVPSTRRRPARAVEVPLPHTPLLACALIRVDWCDAYAAALPLSARGHAPEAWADAVFRAPPPLIRALFATREVLVRLCGIEAVARRAFDTVAWTPEEVLLGIDQRHLGFRASVLVRPDRVVVSTIVELRNRRGRAYFALVRRIHPWVVRTMLTRAVDTMAVSA